MKTSFVLRFISALSVFISVEANAADITAWGYNLDGRATVPTGLSNVISIAVGVAHSMALCENGTVVSWGDNYYGESTVPSGLSNVMAIGTGRFHDLAVKKDGTVVGWGDNESGQTSIPVGLSNVVKVAGGWHHSLALLKNGTVRAWGGNTYGQTAVPAGLSNVVAISSILYHNLALRSDGTVVAWGDNSRGQSSVPAGLSNVVAVSAGEWHNLALKSDGRVVAWGWNQYGQTTVPAGITNAIAVAAGGAHSLILKADKTLVGFGYNSADQATIPASLSNVVAMAAGGNHNVALFEKPFTVPADDECKSAYIMAWGYNVDGRATVPTGLSNVVSIAVGVAHSVALREEGTVVSWGDNYYGESTVPPGLSNVMAIGTGRFHDLAVKKDGTVVGWGDNESGQTSIPVGLSNVVKVAGGWHHSLALLKNGTVRAWGGNTYGQTAVPAGLSNVVAISSILYHNLALRSDGTVVAWGDNSRGQTSVPSGLSNVVKIAAGEWHNLALKSDGRVVAWGWNGHGQTDVPAGLSNALAIAAGGAHSLILKSDKTLSGFGYNGDGQATIPASLSNVVAMAAGGNHNVALLEQPFIFPAEDDNSFTVPTDDECKPADITAWGYNVDGRATVPTGLSNVVSIAVGVAHSMALRAEGTVVSWGDNYYGESTVPSGLSNVVAIGTGRFHDLAVKKDGTVSGWGDNESGQTSIPAGLSNVVKVAGGWHHSVALLKNGTVRAWGGNTYGQTSVPAGLNHVVAISSILYHTLALRSNGTVVAWGDNSRGQISVPVGLSNVVKIAAGEWHNLALKSDGSVVAWGWNQNGQVTVPAGLSNAIAIAAGGAHSLVLKSDKTLIGFGYNVDGQATIPASLSNVVAMAAGGNHNVALYKTPLALPDEGLVLHYSFDEAPTGMVRDLSRYGNNGTPYGVQYTPDGILGGALLFDGTNDYVDAGSAPSLQVTSNFTLSAWIWPDTFNAEMGILAKSYGAPYQDRRSIEFGLTPLDTLSGYFWNSSTKFIAQDTPASSFPRETWTHVIMQHDVSLPVRQMRMYINGKMIPLTFGYETISSIPVVRLVNEPWLIGSLYSPSQGRSTGFFKGKIDDVRIYNYVLTSNEVAALCAEGQSTVKLVVAGSPAPIGSPSPYPYGTNLVMVPSLCSNSVESPVGDGVGIRSVCKGWTGTGSVPASGATNTVAFTITGDSTLTWQWGTEYLLDREVSGDGSVDVADGWHTNGAWVTLTATPVRGSRFLGWSGDVSGAETNANSLTVRMTGPKTVTAGFVLNDIAVLTDVSDVTVPEGGASIFRVKLSAQPAGDIAVAVSRTAGDTDLAVATGASLTFTPDNWNEYQAVSVSAEEDDADNQDETATVTCSGTGIASATVDATESDDDYTLTIHSLYGTVVATPDLPYYDNGSDVILTALPDAAYCFAGFGGDVSATNNPVTITMNADADVTVAYGATALEVLPAKGVDKKTFTARWRWTEGGAPEGELSAALDPLFTSLVPGYEAAYVVNSPECQVTNLVANHDYWYRVRRLMPDGSFGPWSDSMKVRTGKGMPVFEKLFSDVPVSKGITQEFSLEELVSGTGTLKVKSSNPNAVKASVTGGKVSLQYLWNGADSASVTLTLTHSLTGYKSTHDAVLTRADGGVAVVNSSALTNAGSVLAQEVTIANQSGEMVYGVRVRVLSLGISSWLINQTGLDPASKAPIREIPCVLPAGEQMVVRLVYNPTYKLQARFFPVSYDAWAIMTPVNRSQPVEKEMTIAQQDIYDGLWLLNLPVNCNRAYSIYYSDDGGDTWMPSLPVIRPTANYLMWLEIDEEAPAERLYKVMDLGL